MYAVRQRFELISSAVIFFLTPMVSRLQIIAMSGGTVRGQGTLTDFQKNDPELYQLWTTLMNRQHHELQKVSFPLSHNLFCSGTRTIFTDVLQS